MIHPCTTNHYYKLRISFIVFIITTQTSITLICLTSGSKSSKSLPPKSSNLFQDKVQGLGQNSSKAKMEKYYETLYSRIHSKDYGLASFGERCDATTLVDLEDHLLLANTILKGQAPDGKYHLGRSVEEHIRPKLRAFYLRSQITCDFHKFLTCDKSSRRCNCSDRTSMHTGQNGGCMIRIGKRCAFTDAQLNHMGIPVIPKESLLINCVGQDSECVSSFGAASKICRCKSGYSHTSGGLECKPTSAHLWSYDNAEEKGHKFLGHGRAMGKTGSSKGNINNNTEEYFLFPEEIKEDLVRLMNKRGHSGQLMKEATSLHSKMEADNDQEEMVIRDIFIRRAASLKYGDHCDPSKQDILDNPPVAMEGPYWVDPKPDFIRDWQLSLLKDKKPLCNFIDALRCDATKKICQCGAGMTYDKDQCHILLGSYCGSDYEGNFEFNPLQDQKRLSSPPSPACVLGSVCESKPLLFRQQCWCPEGKTCGGESNQSSMLPPPEELFKDIQARFTLHLNDDCDPKAHLGLLNPSEAQVNNYKLRVSFLEKLLGKSPPTLFCNLDKFLNCSVATKRCECFGSLVEHDGECRVRNRDSCLETYSHGVEFYPHGLKMWKIEKVFVKEFKPQCIPVAECDAKNRKCVCNNGQDGDICDNEKSAISGILKSGNIAGYEAEKDINEAFNSLNDHTIKVQAIMSLDYNEKCDVESGTMLERIIQFFNSIANSDPNIAGGKTLYQYQKAAKWLSYLMRTGIPKLCNGFNGLFCHPTLENCQCHIDYVYENGSCKLNANHVCDPHPVASWVPVCRKNSECLPSVINFRHSCQCQKGWSGEGCSENATKSLECESNVKNCEDIPEENKTSQKPDTEYTLENVQAMLEEIKTHRSVQAGADCNPALDKIFTILFPTFPQFDLRNPNHLPKGLEHSNKVLTAIYESAGHRICDRLKHLTCHDNGKCSCDLICSEKQYEDLCNGKWSGKLKPRDFQIITAICKMNKWSKTLKG